MATMYTSYDPKKVGEEKSEPEPLEEVFERTRKTFVMPTELVSSLLYFSSQE